ncbi:hypothetical protein HanXRQr2_Chr17g0784211 [Helianthus annuus]|uniref:Uncharacterized protein n=1 Tax=Helianthus annuus TaxID=4232 RepID=A0A9K3GT32_HELAN|nr:hypothetical protein HanXRQr2_Chr17g0784211 [Helianthus annuus]
MLKLVGFAEDVCITSGSMFTETSGGSPTTCIHELSPSSNPEPIAKFCFNVWTKFETCPLSLISGGRTNSNT